MYMVRHASYLYGDTSDGFYDTSNKRKNAWKVAIAQELSSRFNVEYQVDVNFKE